MSEILLTLILICLLLVDHMSAVRMGALKKWLDAYAEMQGDQMRELINEIKKGGKK